MLKYLLVSIIFLILSFNFTSCSHRQSVYNGDANSDEVRTIQNVPFVKQKDQFCGPASMASVLNFYGQNISQEEISKEVYTPELNGALISDMENFAREVGYRAQTMNGDSNKLIALIDEGVPPIVLVDLGMWIVSVPHYYVVYGYNKSKRTFLIHTGFRHKEIGFTDFDKEWEKMNRLMLIVRK